MDESPIHRFMAHVGTSLADILFPPWCLSCQAPDAWLCGPCQATIGLLPTGWCGRCGRRSSKPTTLCRRCAISLGLTRLTSVLPYEGTVERVLRGAKYRPARIGLNQLLTPTVLNRLLAAVPPSGWLVPIPLHHRHEQRRGFNQAELIARVLLPRPQWTRLSQRLTRRRDRPRQVGLSRAARLTNLFEAFHWAGPSLTGQTVGVVDDVMTTGATLAEAARALRAAGARHVVALTLAQTPPGRGEDSRVNDAKDTRAKNQDSSREVIA